MNSGRTVAHYRAEVQRLESQLAAATEKLTAYQRVVDAAEAWNDTDEADDIAGVEALIGISDALEDLHQRYHPDDPDDPAKSQPTEDAGT